jgi:uncharacterized protein
MSTYLPHIILKNNFLLSHNRTLFWEEQQALILSDVHLGKTGHFRKAGIAIPQSVLKEDLFRLLADIQFFKATKLIIVGDLFHSHENKEHALFLKWRKDIPTVEINLILGNHDILHKDWYKKAGIIVHFQNMVINNFIFTHDIKENDIQKEKFYFSGHIHPCIVMKGIGRQQIKLPCFFFSENQAVLPAFGKFTGMYPIKPQKGDCAFLLVENSIIKHNP